METVLFVGGSADGKRLTISQAVDRVDLYAERGTPPAWLGDGSPHHIVQETYYRQSLHSGDREYIVYLVDTSFPSKLIPLLIEGYRRKE